MRHIKILISVLLLTGCAEQEQPKPQISFKPTGDTKHTMAFVLDPAADHIWDSAGSITTVDGTEDLAPTTDEGWLAVEHSAVVVAESGNLLLMPGRTVDDPDWDELSLALVDAGMNAQKAAAAQNADALFDAGGQIYRVCLSCHTQFIEGEGKVDPLGD